MTPMQCKLGRTAVGWNIKRLAEEAGNISPNTVYRFENGKDYYQSTADKLEQALLSTGKVRFEGDKCVCLCGSE